MTDNQRQPDISIPHVLDSAGGRAHSMPLIRQKVALDGPQTPLLPGNCRSHTHERQKSMLNLFLDHKTTLVPLTPHTLQRQYHDGGRIAGTMKFVTPE